MMTINTLKYFQNLIEIILKKYANLFSNTYDTLNYAWFTINKQGIEDRITFIKLMIDLVNKKIEQENN